MDDLCEGITQSGLRCRRVGNPYCYQHRPPADALNFEAHQARDEDAEDQDSLFADAHDAGVHDAGVS